MGSYIQPSGVLVPISPQGRNRYTQLANGPIPTPMLHHRPSCLNIFLCGLLANKISGFVAGNINELAVKAAHLTRVGQPFYVRTDYYSISAINLKKTIDGQAPVVREVFGDRFVSAGRRLQNNQISTHIFRNTDGVGRKVVDILGIQNEGYFDVKTELDLIIFKRTPPSRGARLGRFGLDNAFGFGVDIGFQLYQDFNNPYLSPLQKGARAGVSGFVGIVGGSLAQRGATRIALAAGRATPPGRLVFAIGVIIGFFFEAPFTNTINDNLFPAKRTFTPLE